MLLDIFQPNWAKRFGSSPESDQLALRTKLHHLQISVISQIVL